MTDETTPDAWAYETCLHRLNKEPKWEPRVSTWKPADNDAVRNVRPLYTRPAPASEVSDLIHGSMHKDFERVEALAHNAAQPDAGVMELLAEALPWVQEANPDLETRILAALKGTTK